MMKKLGVISRCDRPDAIAMVKDLQKHLEGKVELLIDPETAKRLNTDGVPVGDMREQGAVGLVSVGGDGTVLRGIQEMEDPLPVLGINIGTIGFLVDVGVHEAFDAVDEIIEGFEVDERSRIDVQINHQHLPPATNEVVIVTASPAKILSYTILINQKKLDELRADGLVLATPTGSTAYAMSAGGPIIDPGVCAIDIVPIAPFKLSARPWVIPDDSTITINLSNHDKDAFVAVDGQYTQKITHNDTVTITRCSTPARFIVINRNGFYEKVKSKLA
ncbi:MAG: NAD kinase [Candidatus Argoarchaeum ethanivorans]|uniref:NAD kinase n=1 Tax=Candidatus Argoarchaeum ethanivorans TaxID=2608793 RepID=A0A811TDH3_9EURY|nr:MAG: NAD kinase [Candidatus Argoarchaeum ethanivorans]